MIEIREETPGDASAIHELNHIAFGDRGEAAVVDRLRASSGTYVSFVAVDDGEFVGYLVFTRATIDGSNLVGMGLGPMAVLPSRRGQGIGAKLIQHGLDHLRQSGCPFVVVRGRTDYFRRFGFEDAASHSLSSEWECSSDESFQVLLFDRMALPEKGGVARYREEFNAARK